MRSEEWERSFLGHLIRIGGVLKAHRIEEGLDLSEVAEKAGMSVRKLESIEAGEYRKLTVTQVHQLCDAMGVGMKRVVYALY